jgi:hypothetical protein
MWIDVILILILILILPVVLQYNYYTIQLRVQVTEARFDCFTVLV